MYDRNRPIRAEFRDYQLAATFGWTRSEIDEQPAVWLDWLLAIHSKVKEAEADASMGRN